MESGLIFFFVIVLFLWAGLLTYFIYRLSGHYNKLIKEIKVEGENKNHIQKVGILRFNPFSDTGGDQSFVLSILDGENTGIVLTSLHSRGTTRWYAKNVRQGKGVDHELSDEEKEAIRKNNKNRI